ncbi:MAG: hypothetical protein NT013_17270 [Planctomycetia bacterium]|nr:hypothetical protein [Planctomycetia bacterium]
MSDFIRKLLGKTVVVTLRQEGANPIKGLLTAADEGFLVVEQLRGTRRVPVHIPMGSVLFFVEDQQEER